MYNNWEPYEQPPVQTTRASYTANGITDGFTLPALKAGVMGFLAGVFSALLVWAFKIQFSAWHAGALVWFGVSAFSFWRYSERGQRLIEAIAGVGLVMMPAPAPPEPEPKKTIRVEVLEDEGRKGTFLDLPSADKLPLLASGVMAGRTFSQDSCAYVGLSRKQFNTLRDELLTRNLAAWKVPGAPAQGVILTAPGRAVFRRLAEIHSPALPGQE